MAWLAGVGLAGFLIWVCVRRPALTVTIMSSQPMLIRTLTAKALLYSFLLGGFSNINATSQADASSRVAKAELGHSILDFLLSKELQAGFLFCAFLSHLGKFIKSVQQPIAF
jgi:hypothetical protein